MLADEVRLDNFVEVKAKHARRRSKANHLAYVGDTTVGKDVNIGAGTIVCNYDGANKHRTVIEDDVHIGSDTQLVAPVTVGRGGDDRRWHHGVERRPAMATLAMNTRRRSRAAVGSGRGKDNDMCGIVGAVARETSFPS